MITQGLNEQGGSVTQGLNSQPQAIVVSISPATPPVVVGDWFVRFGKSHPLQGPYSYQIAEKHARWQSKERGYAEMVTFLGARAGDPITQPPVVFVDGIFAGGKKFLRGRSAQYHADNELLRDFLKPI